jgi:hypothetical protein
MLIVPPNILLLKLLQLLRWRRWLRDLSNEVRGRSFGDSVDQDSQERDFEEEEESDGEAVEHAAAVVEPQFLLLGRVADAGEVGVELGSWLVAEFLVSTGIEEESYQFTHERATGEVALQEHDQVPLRQENATAENHYSRLPANGLVERVETSRRQHESAHIRQH